MIKKIEYGSTSSTRCEVNVNKTFLGFATAVKSFDHFGVVDVAIKEDFTGINKIQFWSPRLIDLSPLGWNLGLSSTKDLLCVPKGGNFLRRLLCAKIIGPNNLKIIRDYEIKEVDDEGYLLEKKSARSVPLTIDAAFNHIKRDVRVKLENPDYRSRKVMFIQFLVGEQFIGESKRRFTLNELNMPVWKTEGSTIPDCMVLDLLTKKQIRRSMELLAVNS